MRLFKNSTILCSDNIYLYQFLFMIINFILNVYEK